MKILLLIAFLSAPACVTPDQNPQGPVQGQAVEAMFVRGGHDLLVDANPVEARAASFGRVVPVVDAFPWVDRLNELHPAEVTAPVAPVKVDVDLSFDAADADPVARRGW